MKTLICMIVDESGSMHTNVTEVIDGYNEFINEQQRIKEDANVFLIKFSHNISTVYSNQELQSVPKLNSDTYKPFGGTALYDAIVDGIKTVDSNKKIDERVIVVIITDGYELSSKRYNKEQVKEMIANYTAKGDWSFVYIGECAKVFANEMGISPKNAINFSHQKGKVKANFEAASAAVTNLRSNKMKASDALLNI